jgi:hypothetical protein
MSFRASATKSPPAPAILLSDPVYAATRRHACLADTGAFPPEPRLSSARWQHACDSSRGEPIADLRALEIDGQLFIAATGKHDHGYSGILSAGRIHRHRRARDILDVGPRLAGNQVVLRCSRSGFRSGCRRRIRRISRPYRHLRVAGLRLPGCVLSEQGAACERSNVRTQAQRLDHRLKHTPFTEPELNRAVRRSCPETCCGRRKCQRFPDFRRLE